jgi:hypothetical protein
MTESEPSQKLVMQIYILTIVGVIACCAATVIWVF